MVSRQIGDLEAHGLVCRRPDPADRRASLVRLTPDGLLLLDRARALRRSWLRDALARTPTADVRTAVELISALTAELAAHARDIGPPRTLSPGPRHSDLHERHTDHDRRHRRRPGRTAVAAPAPARPSAATARSSPR